MGKQVAVNTTIHYTMELFESEDGVFQPIIRSERSSLIKGEYLPVGRIFVFPKKWGRKEGARILLEHLIKDDERIISSTQHRLERLQLCKAGVDKWSDE